MVFGVAVQATAETLDVGTTVKRASGAEVATVYFTTTFVLAAHTVTAAPPTTVSVGGVCVVTLIHDVLLAAAAQVVAAALAVRLTLKAAGHCPPAGLVHDNARVLPGTAVDVARAAAME